MTSAPAPMIRRDAIPVKRIFFVERGLLFSAAFLFLSASAIAIFAADPCPLLITSARSLAYVCSDFCSLFAPVRSNCAREGFFSSDVSQIPIIDIFIIF